MKQTLPIGKIAIHLQDPLLHILSRYQSVFWPVLHVFKRNYIENHPDAFNGSVRSLELSAVDDRVLWGVFK